MWLVNCYRCVNVWEMWSFMLRLFNIVFVVIYMVMFYGLFLFNLVVIKLLLIVCLKVFCFGSGYDCLWNKGVFVLYRLIFISLLRMWFLSDKYIWLEINVSIIWIWVS